MDEISAVVSLRYVIMQVFDDLELYTQRKFRHYLNIAKKGLVHLQTHVIKDITAKEIPIDANTGIALFPDDYMYYTLIGIIQNNKMYPVLRSDNIPMFISSVCGDDSNEFKTMQDYSPAAVTKHGRMYNATGGKYPLAYRLDHKNQRIFFQGHKEADKLYMEYVSTGVTVDGDVLIPRYIVPALTEWIHWKRLEYNPLVNYREKERRRQMFYYEAMLAGKVKRNLKLQEIMDAINSQVKSTPKR